MFVGWYMGPPLIEIIGMQLADWVNNAVLSKDDPRKRSWVIKHFILTAEVCSVRVVMLVIAS